MEKEFYYKARYSSSFMKEDLVVYTIGQVAKKYNLSIHTLRYYEKEGLLPFVKRTSSGIRQFDDNAIDGIRIIECLKKTGMPLKKIKEFIDSCIQGDETLIKRKNMFHERKKVVLDQIQDLNNTLNVIKYKCWYYDTAVEFGSEKKVMNLPIDQLPNEVKSLYDKYKEEH